jgi:Type II secretion system protein C
MKLANPYTLGLDLVLAGLLAYLVVLLVNDVVSARATYLPAHLAPMARINPPTDANRPRADYQEIIKRDIFNLAPAAPPPVEVASDLHLTLVGVSHLSRAKPFIVVQGESDDQQSLFRLDDDVPDAGKLVEVGKDRAVFERAGRRVVLVMPQNLSDGATGDDQPVSPRRAMVEQERSELLQSMKDAGGRKAYFQQQRQERRQRLEEQRQRRRQQFRQGR